MLQPVGGDEVRDVAEGLRDRADACAAAWGGGRGAGSSGRGTGGGGFRAPTTLPHLSYIPKSRGDSTPFELFLDGVRAWEPGIRRLLSAKAVSED